MKTLNIKLLLVVLAFSISTFAYAATVDIDFDDYQKRTSLAYADGVSFSLLGAPDSAGDPSINYSGLLTNSRHGGRYPTANILQFVFDELASDVSFVFNNAGRSPGGRGASFFEAFDLSGELLETGNLNGASLDLFALTSIGIKTIQFNNNSQGRASWWFGVSSLDATTAPSAVPVPAAVWLFGSGLMGLIAMRKKPSHLSALPA